MPMHDQIQLRELLGAEDACVTANVHATSRWDLAAVTPSCSWLSGADCMALRFRAGCVMRFRAIELGSRCGTNYTMPKALNFYFLPHFTGPGRLAFLSANAM